MKYTDQIRDRLYEAKRHRPYEEQDRHEQASVAWSAVYQHAPTDLITFIRLVDTLEHQHSPYGAVLRHPTGGGEEGTAVVACAACAHDAPVIYMNQWPDVAWPCATIQTICNILGED